MGHVVRAIVRGKHLELLDDPGLAEGELVTLEIQRAGDDVTGTLRGSGETVDSPFWDEVLDEFSRRPLRPKRVEPGSSEISNDTLLHDTTDEQPEAEERP